MHLSSQADLPAREILRDLLAGLPLWQDRRERQTFLEFALQGHPTIADFEHTGSPMTPASELATRLHRHAYRPGEDGRHPVCALLREIRTRRQDANSTVAERVTPLARFFGCDSPPPTRRPGSPYPGLQASRPTTGARIPPSPGFSSAATPRPGSSSGCCVPRTAGAS
jgi:hypothetical protein